MQVALRGKELRRDIEAILIGTNQARAAGSTTVARTTASVLSWLKTNTDKASQGNSGIGTPSHVAGIFLQNAIGARWPLVPYRSAGLSMQDLVAGNIEQGDLVR